MKRRRRLSLARVIEQVFLYPYFIILLGDYMDLTILVLLLSFAVEQPKRFIGIKHYATSHVLIILFET